jgi:Arc/MetJ-type ribon-helix-helix transcriptional regulator
MEITQIRIPKGLLEETQVLIDKGYYTNKSDLIRDAIRKLVLEYHIGSVHDKKNSVAQIKKVRKVLSKQVTSFKDLQ